MNTHKFAPIVNTIIILSLFFTPVYAQYGPVLTNPSAPYIPQSVAPGQYNPVITTPGTQSPYSTTTTSGTNTTSGTTGWNGWGGTTTSGYVNNGAYGAQSISPTTTTTTGTNTTSGTTGWNGWGGTTTSGYVNNGSYSPTISSPGVSYTGGGTVATSSTGWNGWNTNGTAGSTTTTTGTSGTSTSSTTTTGGVSGLVSVSTLGSTYVSSQVATISGAWLSNGGSVGTWFEYGTSESGLTDRTTGYQQTNSSGSWTEQLAGLTPNTIYYYRAVTENTFGKSYGAIRSFKTKSLVSATTTTTTGTTGIYNTSTGGSGTTTTTSGTTGTTTLSTGAVSITNRYTNICPEDDVDYAINYKNTTGKKLNNVVVKVYLPENIEYRTSTTGTYRLRENSVTVIIGTLDINESGIVYVTGQATNDVRGRRMDGKAEITYDGQNGVKIKEEALVTNLSEDCDGSNLGATAFWGNGFFPTTFLGWLLLFLFILFLIWISRRFMYRPSHHTGGDHGSTHH